MNAEKAQQLLNKLSEINDNFDKGSQLVNCSFPARNLMEAYIQIGNLRVPVSRDVALRHIECFMFDLEKHRDAIKAQLNINEASPPGQF